MEELKNDTKCTVLVYSLNFLKFRGIRQESDILFIDKFFSRLFLQSKLYIYINKNM